MALEGQDSDQLGMDEMRHDGEDTDTVGKPLAKVCVLCRLDVYTSNKITDVNTTISLDACLSSA